MPALPPGRRRHPSTLQPFRDQWLQQLSQSIIDRSAAAPAPFYCSASREPCVAHEETSIPSPDLNAIAISPAAPDWAVAEQRADAADASKGDCDRPIEETSEGSFEKSQECTEHKMYGRETGFDCSRRPFRKLVGICPWMER